MNNLYEDERLYFLEFNVKIIKKKPLFILLRLKMNS